MGHRVYFPDLADQARGSITIPGDEAHHALRVKRLGVGDAVEVLDGRGLVAHTRIAATSKTREGWAMELAVERTEEAARMLPAITVASATPKGERLEDMIDGLSQVGAAAWRPVRTKRTVVDPREGKLERLERTAVESMKQCGRAWRLGVLPTAAFQEVLSGPGRVVIADASGSPYVATGADDITILIGPEGGWDPDELAWAVKAGAGVVVARFGPHVLRTEVAAVVAAAQVMAAEQAWRARPV